MRSFIFIILLFPFYSFAQTQNSSPFGPTLSDLTIDISNVVLETPDTTLQDQSSAGVVLSQARDLSDLAITNTCSTTIGVTEQSTNDSIQVVLADSDISGLPYIQQIASLIQQHPSLAQYRNEISSYSSLLMAYRESLVQSQNRQYENDDGVILLSPPEVDGDGAKETANNGITPIAPGQSPDAYIESLSSTDLALLVSGFAQDRYQLYLPPGLLTIETVAHRIARDQNNLASAFRGVSDLSMDEKLGIIHVLSNRVSEDRGAGSTQISRTQRIGQYFSSAGFNDGVIVRERVRNQEKISLYVYSESEQRMVRHIYDGPSGTIANTPEQGFYSLTGNQIENDSVSELYRGVLQGELIAGTPSAWQQTYVPTDNTHVSFNPPVIVTPAPSNVPNFEATPAPAELTGSATFNLRTGSGAGLITSENVNLIQSRTTQFTNLDQVNLPLANTNGGLNLGQGKPQGPNPLGLGVDGGNGQSVLPTNNDIYALGLNTNAQNGSTTLSLGTSNSNGVEAYGLNLSGTVNPDADNTVRGSAFYQNNPQTGNLRSYGASINRDDCNLRGRSFFSIDNSDNTDPQNIVRGTRFTGELEANSNRCRNTESGVSARLGTAIPVGDSDTVIGTVNLDSDDGVTGYSTGYSTTTDGGTTLTAGVVNNQAGNTSAVRVDRTNTNIILSNNRTNNGLDTNTFEVRQNFDPILPDNVNAVGQATIVRGDTGSSNTFNLNTAVAPGGREDDLRILSTVTLQNRQGPNGEDISNTVRADFNINDTVAFNGNDIGAYRTGVTLDRSRTPQSTTNRETYNAEITLGADRLGNTNDSLGGLSSSLSVTYIDEQTINFDLANLGEQGGDNKKQTVVMPITTDPTGSVTNRERIETRITIQHTFDGPLNLDGVARVGAEYFRETLTRGGTLDVPSTRNGYELGGEVELYDPVSNRTYYASLIRTDSQVDNSDMFTNRYVSQDRDGSEVRFMVGLRLQR